MLTASLAEPASVARTSAVWKTLEPIGADNAKLKEDAEVEVELLDEEVVVPIELDVVIGDELAEELV
jgi:hypothetical protein